MAGVEPFSALHYDLEKVGDLSDVVAPPYDVIDAARRAELAGKSPYNVVGLDLPEDPDGGDIYEHAGKLLGEWKADGALVEDGPAVYALTQDYTAPDGRRMTRRGFLARVKLAQYGEGVRPHERTQPGPKEDRLRLTRATKHNLSPIFSLYPGDAWPAIEPAIAGDPWAEVTDEEETTHRIWRIEDPAVHKAIASEVAEGELLIADGHHRYETSLAYQREVGAGGPQDYILMALVSLEDPGLTVFATHRLLKDLSQEQREAIRDAAKAGFELREVGEDELIPDTGDPPGSFGYMDAHHMQPYRLIPKGPELLDEALAGNSDAYRRLDAAALEQVFLKDAVGLSADDIAAKKQLGYTPNADDAVAKLRAGAYDAAFFLRPTPVEQVREVAAEGETMPPKSTYFFPKLLTGIAFNPLG